MTEKFIRRIMEGARTPEGKVIAILLALCLSLMSWNVAAISFAVNGNNTQVTAAPASESQEPQGVEGTVVEEPAPAPEPEPAPAPEPEPAAEPQAEQTQAAPADNGATEQADQQAAAAGAAADASASAASADKDKEASDASADKKDEEKDKEVKKPAQHFEGASGTMRVIVDSPEGALPENTKMLVTNVAASQVINQVENVVDGEVENVLAVDISFTHEGKTIEPEKPINVTFSAQAIAEAAVNDTQEVAVVHIADNGAAEVVKEQASPASSEVAITSSEFSVYVIVTASPTGDLPAVETDARLEVIFHGQNDTTTSMLVKKTDSDNNTLNELLFDPGIGELPDDQVFLGWTTKQNYTVADSSSAMDIEKILAYVTNMLNKGVTEGDKLDLYPVILKPYYVTYLDEYGAVIQTDTALFAEGSSAEYTVNALYVAKEADENFEGWYAVSGSESISGDSFTAGDDEGSHEVFGNGSTATLTGNVTLRPYVPRGKWLIFKENGKGATYTSAQFVKSNAVTKEPATPTRFGYTFGGWYTTQAATDGTAFTFGQPLMGKTELYAKWVPNATANYTVIIWKQNLSGEGYDFEESIPLNGKVGSVVDTVVQQGSGDDAYVRINGTNKEYTGFHLDHFDQNVEIRTEGNAIVNVYYNRNVVTLTFYKYGKAPSDEPVQVAGPFTEGREYSYYTKNADGSFSTSKQTLYYHNGKWYRTKTTAIQKYAYNGTADGTYYTSDDPADTTQKKVYYNDSDGKWYDSKSTSERYVAATTSGRTEGWYEVYQRNTHWFSADTYDAATYYYKNGVWYDSSRCRWQDRVSDVYEKVVDTSWGNVVASTVYTGVEQSSYTDLYNGYVYDYETSTQNKWYVAYSYSGLYGSTLKENSVTWPSEMDWYNSYSNGAGTGTRTTFLDAFLLSSGDSSENFYAKASSGTKTIKFYKQNEAGDGYELANEVKTTGGSFSISDKYSGFTAYQYRTDGGRWQDVGAKTVRDGNTYYGSAVSNYDTLEIRFNRNQYGIHYMDGSYFTGRDALLSDYEPIGELGAAENIVNGADISSYGKGGANYFEPESPYDGFIFDGWYTDDTCTHKFDFTTAGENGAIKNATLSEGGLTLYAKWRQKEYRVFMHPNATLEDGTDDPTLEWSEDQSMSFRRAYGSTISEATGHRDGYELVGWFTDEAFTQPYGFGADELNDSTVTGEYSKTEPTELDAWGHPAEAGNRDADRYWIFNKLDLYAKWRATLEGAKGITVQYVLHDGSVYHTDADLYTDAATAYATSEPQEALGDNVHFKTWMIQRWDATAGAFVDTGDTVYPGSTFTVKKDFAHQEPVEPDTATAAAEGEEPEAQYTYTFQLRALDNEGDQISQTAIHYDANGGAWAQGVQAVTDFTTNSTQHLLGEGSATRTGYELAGWSLTATGGADFVLGEEVSADNLDRSSSTEGNDASNTLYAVWKPVITVTSSDKSYDYNGQAQGPFEEYTITSDIAGFTPMTVGAGTANVALDGKTYAVTIASDANATVTNMGDTAENKFTADAPATVTANTAYGTLNIAAKTVTVKAVSTTKTYGAEDPEFTATVEGLLEGDSAPEYTVERTESGDNVGSYAITPTGETTQGNYKVVFEPGTLTIEPAPLTITVNAQNYEYNGNPQGEGNGDAAATYEGAQAAAKVSAGEGQLKYNDAITGITLAGAQTAVGTYEGQIVATNAVVGGNTGNYTITYVPGTLTITPSKAMAVTAVGNEKVYDGTALAAAYEVDVPDGSDATITYRSATEKSGDEWAWSDWSDTAPSITEVGTTVFQVRAQNDNYEDAISEVAELKVTPLAVTVTVVGANNTAVYDGSAHTVTGYTATASSTLYRTAAEGETPADFTFEGAATATQTNAGTANMNLAASQFTNDNANFEVTFEITDGYQTVTPITSAVVVTVVGKNNTAEYDGGSHAVEGYTATADNALYNVGDVAFTGAATAARTDAGTTNMGLAAGQFSNTSANFTNVTFNVTDGYQTITAAPVTVKIKGHTAEAFFDGAAHEASGYDVVSISNELYTEGDFSFNGAGSATQTAAGTASMGLAAGQFVNNNANFNVSFVIVADGSVTVKAIDVVVTITGHNNSTAYDGQAHSVSGYDTSFSTPLYTAADFTFTGAAAAERTDAGTTYMGLTAEQFANTNPNFANVTFNVTDGFQKVNPIDVTVDIVGANRTEPYAATEYTVNGYTATASTPLYDVDNDFIYTGLGSAAARIDVGTTNMGLAATQFRNTNTNFANVTFNVTDGFVTVEPIDVVVTIVGANNTAVYDGAEHSVSDYTATANTQLYDVAKDFTFSGTAAAARTNVGTTNMGLAAGQFANTNPNFGTVTFNVTDGYQTITPVDEVVVTITGHTNTANYDGSEHTVDGYDVQISNPLYTEADFTFSGTASATQQDAGTANMNLAADQFVNTNENFANVTFNVTDGYQTINPIDVTVTITGHNSRVDYDGTEHSVSGYDVEISNPLYKDSDFTFSGTAAAARTDAGTTNMGLAASQFTNTNANFASVAFNVTDGYQTINPIDVTVTVVGNNSTTDYDGGSHTVTGYTATADNALYNVNADIAFSGSASAARTDAGTTNMNLAAGQFKNTNANFGTVTFEITDGYQTINPIDVTVAIVGENNTVDYDGTAHSVTGYTATADSALYDVEKDFTFSGTASASRIDAGTTNMGLSASQFTNINANFATVTFEITDGYQTVNTIDVVVTINGTNSTVAYDGTEHAVSGYKATADSKLFDVDKDIRFNGEANAARTDAGTTSMGLKADQFANTNGNFGTVTFNVNDGYQAINPIDAVVTIVGANNTAEYDGKAHSVTGFTATSDTSLYRTAAEGDAPADFTFNGNQTATRTEAGTTGMGLAASQFTNNNPNFANVTFNVTDGYQAITPVDEVVVTITGHNNTTDYDGAEHSISGYDVQISNALYTEADFTFSGTAEAARTSAGTTNMGLAATQFANTNENFAKVTFNVVDGYQAINKINVTVTIVGATNEAAYDGRAHEVSGYTATANTELYDVSKDFTFSGSAEATQTDAGTADMGLTAEQFANTNDNFGTVTFEITDGYQTITPIDATVTIVGNNNTAAYDAVAHSVSGYTATADTQLYDVTKDFTFSGSDEATQTNAGTATMGLAAEQFTNTNPNFANVTFNVTDGYQTITPINADVYITGKNLTSTYNGNDRSVSGYDVTRISTPLYTEADFDFNGTATATRKIFGTTNMGLAPEQFTNKNANFATVTFHVTDGFVQITAVPSVTVTVIGNNNATDYDGQAHSVDGYRIAEISDALFSEADITFTGAAAATRTEAGTTNMGLTAGQFANSNANFRTVTFNVTDGYQTIKPINANVTIIGHNNTTDYDGAEHSVSGFTPSTTSALYDVAKDFTFSGNQTAARTNAGKTDMGLAAEQFTNTNPNFASVAFSVTDGYQAINKINAVVTINGHNNTTDYDGAEHSVGGYDTSFSTPLYDATMFTFSGNAAAKRTDAGTTNMGLAAAQFANTSENFGAVTFNVTDGYQTIEPINATVTIIGHKNTTTYDGNEHSVSGYDVEIDNPLYKQADFTFTPATGAQIVAGAITATRADQGTTNMGLAPEQFANTNANFGTVTFKVTDGYQEITALDTVVVTIKGNTDKVTYNGSEQAVTGYTATANSALYDVDSNIAFNGTARAAGTNANAAGTSYAMGLAADQFVNTNPNFSNVRFEVIDGSLTIDRASLTITTGSDSKPYDGTALTNATVGIEGLQNNETATVAATGTITDFGNTPNTRGDIAWGTANADNYTVTDKLGTLTITANPVEITLTAADGSKTYDGTELTNGTVTVTGLENLPAGNGLRVEATASGTATHVGDEGANVVNDGFKVYNAAGTDVTANFTNFKKVPGKLTINPAQITVTTSTAAKQYDGTPLTSPGAEITGLVPGETATVAANGTITEPALAGGAAAAATVDNTYAAIEWGTARSTDYTVTDELGTLTISANSDNQVILHAPSGSKTYDGTPLTAAQAAEAAELSGTQITATGLPETASFQVVGTASGTVTNVNPGADETPTTTVDDGYRIMLDGKDVTAFFTNIVSTGAQTQGALTIAPATMTVAAQGYQGVYDGASHGPASITNTALNSDDVTNDVTYAYTWTDAAGATQSSVTEPTITNFGKVDYTVTATSPNYNPASATFSLEVTKRPVTLTSASAEQEYNGNPLTNNEVTVGGQGFVDGEGVASYTVTGTQTLVGSSENAFTYTLNSATSADNYDITVIPGTLNVTSRDAAYEITLTANSGEFTYDANDHEVTDFTTLRFEVEGNAYTVDAESVSATSGAHADVLYATGEDGAQAAASYPVNIIGTPVVRDAAGNDVSDQFAVSTQAGAMTINPRTVRMSSESATQEFNGNALVRPTVTIESGVANEGFVAGQGAVAKATGSVVYAGDSAENAIEYTLNEGTQAGNYNIVLTPGTLSVTNRTQPYAIEVVANSASETYDGTAHTASGFKTLSFTVDGNAYTVSGLTTSDPSMTDVAADLTNAVSGTPVVTDAAGADVTGQFAVATKDGTLHLDPAEITVTTGSAAKEYDGTALEGATVPYGSAAAAGESAQILGLAAADAAVTAAATASVTTPDEGAVDNIFEITWGDSKDTNYTVVKELGTLQVNANTTEIVATAPDGTKVYDGQPLTAAQAAETLGWEAGVTATGVPAALTYAGTASGSVTNVGDATTTVASFQVLSGSTDVTKYFSNVKTTGEGTTGTLSVTARPVTLTSGTAAKDYDGTPLKADTITASGTDAEASGFVTGEGLVGDTSAIAALFTLAASHVAPNTYENTFATDDQSIRSILAAGTDFANYDFSFVPGTLTVNPLAEAMRLAINLVANGYEGTYDGQPHMASGFQADTFTIGEGTFTVAGATSSLAGTNVADSAVVPYDLSAATVADAYGNVVTDQFALTATPGMLTINKRPLQLASATLTKEYDGNAMGNANAADANVTASAALNERGLTVESGWVAGEGATYTFGADATRTLPGTSQAGNVFTITPNANTSLDNYEYTPVYGDLVITDRTRPYEITVAAAGESFVYDGTEHAVEGFETLEFTVEGNTYTVSGLEASGATMADVEADKTSVVSGTPVVTDASGNVVTGQFIVNTANGTLHADKRPVVLTSGSAEKGYDGTPLAADTITASGTDAEASGFVAGQGLVDDASAIAALFTLAAQHVAPSTYANTFATSETAVRSILAEGTNFTNYAFSFAPGTLTVNPLADATRLAINLVANGYEGVYDGAEHAASGFESLVFTGGAEGSALAAGSRFTVSGATSEKVGAHVADSGEVPYSLANAVVTDAYGNDVTAQVNLTVTPGTMTITPATMTVAAIDYSGMYDGGSHAGGATNTALEDDRNSVTYAYTWTDHDGDHATNVAPTITNAGEVSYKVVASHPDYADATDEGGSLAVTTRSVTLKSATENKTYDGTALENHSVEVTGDGFVAGEGVTYSFTGSQTNYGSVANRFTYSWSDSTLASNYAVTGPVYGTLSVSKAPLTVSTGSASKAFDGKALTNDEIRVAGLQNGETAPFVATGSRTYVGESTNTYNAVWTGTARADNYQIATENLGTLIVHDGIEGEPATNIVKKSHFGQNVSFGLDNNVIFTISVVNPYDDARTITLTEQGGVELAQTTFADVPGHATVSTTAAYTVDEAAIINGYTNTVTATFSGTNTSYSDDDTVITDPAAPGMTMTMEVVNLPDNGYFELGQTIEYVITISNPGNVTLRDVTVSDPTVAEAGPDGTLPAIGSIAPGGSTQIRVTHVVTEEDIRSQELVNTATATANPPAGVEGDVTATARAETGLAVEDASVHVTKTLADSAEAGHVYRIGETVAYDILVSNNGNVTLNNVAVVDTLAAEAGADGVVATIGTLAPGAFERFAVTHAITEDDVRAGAGTFTNVASATGTDDEGVQPTDEGTVDVPIVLVDESLNVTKELVDPSVEIYYVGDVIDYVITVTNDGNVALSNVRVVDELDAEMAGEVVITGAEGGTIEGTTVSYGSLAAGESRTINVSYEVQRADTGKPIVNGVVASADDTTPGDGSTPTSSGSVSTAPAEPEFTLTVHSVYDGTGAEAAPDVVETHIAGEAWNVEFQQQTGFTTSVAGVAARNLSGTMGAADEEYTVVYTPVIVPASLAAAGAAPGPVAGVVAGVAAGVAAAAPAPAATVTIADDGTPLVESIEDDGNALASGLPGNGAGDGSWALLNVLATVLAVVLAAVMLIGIFGRKRDEDSDGDDGSGGSGGNVAYSDAAGEDGEATTTTYKRRRLLRLASIVPAVVTVVLLLLTQDFTKQMVLVDAWTIVFILLAVVNVVLLIASRKKAEDDTDDDGGAQPTTAPATA